MNRITIYLFNLVITKLTSFGDRFKIIITLKDYLFYHFYITNITKKSKNLFTPFLSFSKISFDKFILYRNLISNSIINLSIKYILIINFSKIIE